MVFSDLLFLFVFIPAFAICYLLATLFDKAMSKNLVEKRILLRNIVIVLFSLVFYGWGEPVYVFLMVFSVFLNYLSGLGIDRYEGKSRKLALALGLIVNLAVLGTFKYADFLAQTLCGLGLNVPMPNIALPIGISFYTFQSISYLVDVYRKQSPAQRHFGNLLLYISMFPQLVAGPIVRYDTVAREINNRSTSAEDVAEGLFRFLIGLGKKVIIANQFSEVADQFLANGVNSLSTAGAWIGAFAYALQIYFDFSGYSDMAIGMGRCMGFHFNENFDHPYISRSVTEFWRRWHMSLGSFFRDYLYIPLGGNRRHQMLNILIVWSLTGLWHGASWNFVLWGLYFGMILLIEKYVILRLVEKVPNVLLHLYTLAMVMFSWGLFYFDDFTSIGKFYTALFGQSDFVADIAEESALINNFWLWVVAVIFCMPTRRWVASLTERIFAKREKTLAFVNVSARTIASIVILILSVALLVGATNNAFIYTRF